MTAIELFYRLILRPLRRQRLGTALTVLAVALGVAAVLAIVLTLVLQSRAADSAH